MAFFRSEVSNGAFSAKSSPSSHKMACCESIIDLTQLNDSISQHVALDRQIESLSAMTRQLAAL